MDQWLPVLFDDQYNQNNFIHTCTHPFKMHPLPSLPPGVSEHKLNLTNVDKNLLCVSAENKTIEVVMC